MKDYQYKSEKPQVEPPLPDTLLERLEELKRRDEARGLTNLEQAILMNDLRQFNEALKPLVNTMAEAMNEVVDNVTSAMEPLVEAMSEIQPTKLGECESCGIDIYQGEWHEKGGDDEENLERTCLPCSPHEPEELADDQMESYEAQEGRR
jgi:hypothetical protein